MSTHNTGRIWLLAAIGGVSAIAVVLVLFRPSRNAEGGAGERGPQAASRPAAVAPAPVGLVPWAEGSADQLLKEEAQLRDPTPLFLPTEWNAAEASLPADFQREPGVQFQSYPARLTFGEADLNLDFPATVVPPEHPAEALALDKPERPMAGFGEAEPAVPVLPGRRAFVEVTASGNGRLMLAQALEGAQPPGDGSWQPLEFLVTVDATGLVRPPVLTSSSRVAAVDDYFQDYLGSVLHVGERLPPGFYRIAIGP